jgi:hypothetical protein
VLPASDPIMRRGRRERGPRRLARRHRPSWPAAFVGTGRCAVAGGPVCRTWTLGVGGIGQMGEVQGGSGFPPAAGSARESESAGWNRAHERGVPTLPTLFVERTGLASIQRPLMVPAGVRCGCSAVHRQRPAGLPAGLGSAACPSGTLSLSRRVCGERPQGWAAEFPPIAEEGMR